MANTGAELLVDALLQCGVKYLFSLSGNQILAVYDATIGRDIDIIHTRHEAGAVHMADGWGRLTEEPGVALLTAGPGHCNGISALYVARMAESPLVLLSGQSPRAQLGRGAFQEMDQVAIARPLCKAAWAVEDSGHLGKDLARACSIASRGRPGPVYLGLPADVLEETVSVKDASAVTEESLAAVPDEQIHRVLALLSEAERPLILAGAAMARPARWGEIAQLAAVSHVPALPMESPRGVDDPWLHGAAKCLASADLVLLIGKKLDFSLKFGQSPFFAASCRFVQIDAEQEELQRSGSIELSVYADPLQAVGQLCAAARQRAWAVSSWSEEVATRRCFLPRPWSGLAAQHPLHPLAICQAVQPYLDQGGVLVSDGGEFGQWAQAGLEAECRLINGPSGSIGSSLPLGLAARLVHPERPVFVFQGDGTFGFHAFELDTALRYNLPVIVIVGNDARWNAEHQLQIKHYGAERTVGCDLLSSRYDKVVEALGGHGELVQRADELSPALERAVAARLPACINVAIDGAAAPTFDGH
jgi:acetolactate synthase-1/2/3 large subunit